MYLRLAMCVLTVSAIFVINGCGGPSEAEAAQATEPRPLTFTIVNNSGGEISQIGLSGAAMPIACRDLTDGQSSAALKNKKLELPEKLTLHWSDARNNRKEGSVKVWAELGASYSGPLTLTINKRGKVTLTGG